MADGPEVTRIRKFLYGARWLNPWILPNHQHIYHDPRVLVEVDAMPRLLTEDYIAEVLIGVGRSRSTLHGARALPRSGGEER